MSLKLPSLFFVLMTLVGLLTFGCGKKAKEESSPTPQTPDAQLSEIELQLSKQELFCGKDRFRDCPKYIAKIAVLFKNELRFCTGFLNGKDVVVTSSSCLPERLRAKDVSCKKDVTFFFARENEKPVRVACDKVLEASAIDTQSEAYSWKSNVTYLKLEEEMDLDQASTSRLGMKDAEDFTSWSVDQTGYFQGVIRDFKNCRSIHRSYFNPMGVGAKSPVITLAGSLGGCEFKKDSNTGSPILDLRGKVRGVLSSRVSETEVTAVNSLRILELPLKKFHFVSNFACAPGLNQSEVNDVECDVPLDHATYVAGQEAILNEATLFKPTIIRIENIVNNLDRNIYLRLGVKLVKENDSHRVYVYPVCFKNLTTWIHTFGGYPTEFRFSIQMPQLKIRKYMTEYSQVKVKELTDDPDTKSLNFEFGPRYLRYAPTDGSPRQANVYSWYPDTQYETHPLVPDLCPASLF